MDTGNKPYNQIVPGQQPPQPQTPEVPPIQPIPTPFSPPVSIPSTPAASPPSPVAPTVVLPQNGHGVPKWFYFIFGITLVVFFIVTTVLVWQLTQKQSAEETTPIYTPRITDRITQVSPTLAASGSATDAAILKLNKLKSSDEISDIESDIEAGDFSSIEKEMLAFDEEAEL